MERLIVYNIGTLATPIGSGPKGGAAMKAIKILNDAYLVIENGKFTEAGSGAGYKKYQGKKIDAQGRLVTPGLIDAHNHLIFAGSREHEFRKRLEGASYLDILAAGGGILETVEKTRAAGFDMLYDEAAETLEKMLLLGISVIEAKSGYGLDQDTELKQLKVIKQLKKNCPQHIIATYLGAHAIPSEYKQNRKGYIDIIKETMEVIKRESLAEFCDVFCEEGVFSYEESKEILVRAKELGFKIRIHADEMTNSGGARLAAELDCSFADHLLASVSEDFTAMAESDVVLVALPLTSFVLDKPFARIREMIACNGALALATDYNPGSCPSYNLHLVMQTAVIKTGMTPAEVLTAVTLNPAYGLGLVESKGSIETGKDADFIIFNCSNLDYFFYRLGENLVRDVYIRGINVVNNGRIV
ncbi:MAG: imidazolonepropionase [Bacilli bacterium]|nr:imidazolonepropionase [Bacilli bacterium]MDD4077476.1 imidazolonepropionase [Bacilli bacterium]MDD4388959.1 imidazolonepropionase [Bacilli bacterium]